MHSFQPSRGRIFFEVLCAFGIVASCVGAWKQTGASALLLAASVAGLYGFVHLFDLVRRNPSMAEEPQRIDFESEVQVEVPAHQLVDVTVAAAEPQLATQVSIEEPKTIEPAAPRTDAGRRKGSSRKGSGRRATASKGAKVIALAAPDEEEAAESVETAVAEEFAAPAIREELAHTPQAPLFEPDPYVRMPRPAFGRKAGRFS